MCNINWIYLKEVKNLIRLFIVLQEFTKKYLSIFCRSEYKNIAYSRHQPHQIILLSVLTALLDQNGSFLAKKLKKEPKFIMILQKMYIYLYSGDTLKKKLLT